MKCSESFLTISLKEMHFFSLGLLYIVHNQLRSVMLENKALVGYLLIGAI